MVFAINKCRITLQIAAALASFLLITAQSIDWDPTCGTTKGCFPECTTGCEYLVTWYTSGSVTYFDLKAEESNPNVSLAIGFSKDRRMGDDSVVGCIVPGNNTVQVYYNEGTHSETLSTPTLGLLSPMVSQANGVITCTFIRDVMKDDDKYFNLNNDYILMLVIGDVENDGSYELGKHKIIPWMSDEKVDFNSNKTYGLYKLNSPLVKLHGIMMILAWLFLVIVGIVTARYFKDMLPDEKLFGTKVWFQIHRGAMVAAVVCVVIGFIPIFVEIEGFSDQILSENVGAHPALGISVTILCFVNPLIALVRPDNDHEFRWIFNWTHLAVGVVSQILAIVTIFLGYILERSMLSNKVIYVTATHVIVIGLACGALEIHKWFCVRRNNLQIADKKNVKDNKACAEQTAKKKNGKDDKACAEQTAKKKNGKDDREMEEVKEPPKPSKIPFYLLVVLGGFCFVFTLALLVMIAVN